MLTVVQGLPAGTHYNQQVWCSLARVYLIEVYMSYGDLATSSACECSSVEYSGYGASGGIMHAVYKCCL